jgi:hypothetical protein
MAACCACVAAFTWLIVGACPVAELTLLGTLVQALTHPLPQHDLKIQGNYPRGEKHNSSKLNASKE